MHGCLECKDWFKQERTVGKKLWENLALNDRGDHLLQFAKLNNLYVTNTKFKHKPSRKWTWESPNGKDKNMIDMILVGKR